MFTTILQVALGGAIGASIRFLIASVVAFPFGTLAINVIGSFLMGIVFVALAEKGLTRWLPFLMAGVLGGFTTFSAFSLDTLKLYEAGRIGAAGGYVLASVALSLLALFVAVAIMRGIQA
ncbi:MAG: fluoride efflux transporter CrcB [Marinosulfonomonas sp.]|nr:MAG: fluoride efflux transporter CrcB [Marinosulfonomonas sp.]